MWNSTKFQIVYLLKEEEKHENNRLNDAKKRGIV